jgi:hypothetical protein
MDATYLSLLIFSLVTILYYFFKPKLSLEDLSGGKQITIIDKDGNPVTKELTPEEAMANYSKKGNLYLIIYFLLVIVSQFFINVGIIVNKCGGNLKDNFAAGALMTFIPWIFIFGLVILVLIIFPGFKSAFSNVVGYFVVAGEANTVLNNLLVNTNIQEALNSENTTPEKKASLQKSAEAIIKLCGNASIMINQIVPDNFSQYWALLEPLMKDEYQNPVGENADKLASLKKQLLGVVITRDNVGEALWYTYTAVLLISIVQYNLSVRGCIIDPKTMNENHQKFLEAEDAKLKQNANASKQVYASGA